MSDLVRSAALNNIPSRKLEEALKAVENSNDTPENKATKQIAINRYYESNIPLEYWTLKMERDFHGDPNLMAEYQNYIADLNHSYINGVSICLAGSHGKGKTFCITCILKKASQKGYTALYTTISDIITVFLQADQNEKYQAKRELTKVDFLAIDEIDPRFIPSDNAADLFARNLENIFRTRSQNKLPTLICTNSPQVVNSFHGALKESMDSLFQGYMKQIMVSGQDYRKNKLER